VQLLRITGARPSEILTLRLCDIDGSEDDVWLVALTHHKNAHHGKARVLVFDQPAQNVMRPYLARPAKRHLFRPVEAVDELHDRRRQLRLRDGGTPLYRSHVARYARDRQQRPRQEFAECYGADSLRQAIDAANRQRSRDGPELLPRWSPYQLRHTFGTHVRDVTGDTNVTAVLLGHGARSITDNYLHPKLGDDERRVLQVLREAERQRRERQGDETRQQRA